MRDYSLRGLLDPVSRHPVVADALARTLRAEPGIAIGPLGLPEAAQPAAVAAIAAAVKVPIVWIVPQVDEARALADSLGAYLDEPARLHLFAAPDPLPYERIAWDPSVRELRMATLAALFVQRTASGSILGPPPVIIAPLRAVLTPTLPPAEFDRDAHVVARGDRMPVTQLVRHLHRLGYDHATRVTAPGEMAHRGGIVDVWPPSAGAPVRLEWFGDDLDALRLFNPATQRSHGTVERLVIPPATEALPGNGPRAAAALADVDLSRLQPLAESDLKRQIEQLANGERFRGLELFTSLLHTPATLLDHLPPDALIVLDGIESLEPAAVDLAAQAETVRAEQLAAGEIPGRWPLRPLVEWTELEAAIGRHRRLIVNGTARSTTLTDHPSHGFSAPPRFGGRVDEAVSDVLRRLDAGDAIVVVSRQAPRIAELITGAGISAAPLTVLETAPGPGGLAVVHGALGSGWELAGADGGRLVVLTDGEIFGWRMPHRRRSRRAAEEASRADEFAEFQVGDHVVHVEHGIGVFRGLVRMQVGQAERDYLHLEYAAGDTLFVPTHQADRVARYVGAGEVSPSVTRLGTADWERAKARARREVEDIAEELLALYARREVAHRAAFAPDTAWQAEMEASFPFLETDDQMKAIDDVKRDMESVRPMDRLVVGDVGFGKTEVALRAAFKAVMAGCQVAILAPTTVLAQQHYETFRERLSAFPVRIDVLSRFRRRKDLIEAIERLGRGEIDIIIGTHRLLGQDVKFKRLGLLVVDEEHRFGVKHKERLRQIAEGVDTLTLTATPIPRTMHLALTGLRDLTTIDTPPAERLPVSTHVGPYEAQQVRHAIQRELSRGGQVFYVHNRVRGIDGVVESVRRLVPEARVTVAHGQMPEDQLAGAMLDFVGHLVDVLVCTSIIESGLDIPNANTLIVERADRFGIAQLHQLRGRVGRSEARAYAYLLLPPGGEASEEARERLQALADYADLGAGFRLAMRDLEIRGAGEILGARQHGHVASIGLDLYTKLLAAAIKRVRADDRDPVEVPVSVAAELDAIDPGTLPTVDLPVDAYLPETYVAETAERTRLYRQMAAADTLPAVGEIEHELIDRFGRPPAEVRHLLVVLRLRVLAHQAGAQSVGLEGEDVAIRFAPHHHLDRTRLAAALPAEARIGHHRVGLPVSGATAMWLTRALWLVQTVADIEGTSAAA
ncbi:MAG: transcription-repair coupling factor [Ardenticatenales bacterium]|nr:transcription-repair coupling factor [Ardenticatenales bacterium]